MNNIKVYKIYIDRDYMGSFTDIKMALCIGYAYINNGLGNHLTIKSK